MDPEPNPEDPKEHRTALLVRLGALAPLAAGLAVYALHPGVRASLNEGVLLLAHGDTAGLREWGRGLGPWAPVGTTVLMIVEAFVLPIPAILVTWTNSWLFGPLVGGFLSITQATLAAIICFVLARTLGEPLVRRLLPARTITRTHEFMAQHGSSAILVARLVPIVPFKGVSYVAGLTHMRLWPFIWATFVGQIPAGIGYSYLGQEINNPASFAIFGIAVFLALLVFGTAVRRATRMRADGTTRPRRATVALLGLAAIVLIGGLVLVFQRVRTKPKPEWAGLKRTIREKFPDVRQLQTSELAAWLQDPSREPPVLLDARAPEEFEISSIPSACFAGTRADLAALQLRLDRKKPIVVFCSVGYRSSDLASRLTRDGFEDVRNLEGSLFQWANEGRPLARGNEPAKTVHQYNETWGKLLDPERRAPLTER